MVFPWSVMALILVASACTLTLKESEELRPVNTATTVSVATVPFGGTIFETQVAEGVRCYTYFQAISCVQLSERARSLSTREDSK